MEAVGATSASGRQTSLGAHLLVALPLILYLLSVALREVDLYVIVFLGIVTLILAFLRFQWGLAFVPFILFNPLRLTPTDTGLMLSEYLLLIVFAVWVLGVLSFQEPLRYPRALLLPVVVIIGAAGVSIFAASYMGAAALQVIRYVEVFLVLFMVVYMTADSADVVTLFVMTILLGGLVAAWVGIYQFVTGEGVRRDTWRVYGLLGGGYGAAMAVDLFLALSVLIYPSPRKLKIAAGVTLPFVTITLFMSQGRTWMGAFLFAVLLSMFLARKKVRRMMLVATAVMVGGVGLLIATNAFGLAEGSLVETVVRSSFRWQTARGSAATEEISLLMRLNAWGHAVSLFLQHPLFGIGAGNLRIADYVTFTLARPTAGAGYIDNQTIQFFTETGIFAGMAWLLFVVNALKIGWRAVRRSAYTNLAGPMQGLFGGLVILLVGSNFWVITPSHELFAFFIIAIALLAAGARIQSLPAGTGGGQT